jgi:SAM-dependent methyltransferase
MSSPFDAVAHDYDRTFGRSPAGRLFRFNFAEHIHRHLAPGARVLDIGCGTGSDAIWFAAQGFDVTGVDVSAAMVTRAEAAAVAADSKARFHHGDVRAVASALGSFDVVTSNFGAMNCVPIAEWSEILRAVVKPGGRAFLVLMGRRPIPEFIRRGPSAWARRGRGEAPLGEAGSVVVHYAGPRDIERALGPDFQIAGTRTLGLLVPRAGMDAFPRKHPALFSLLASAETFASRFRVLARFSDHFLLDVARREPWGAA